MQISVTIRSETAVWTLAGRLDAVGAAEFDRAWKENAGLTLAAVIDMGAVDYLSSAGLRILLAAYQGLRKRGGVVTLAQVQPYCRQVIEITGLAQALPIFANLDDALAHCEEILRAKASLARWDQLEAVERPCGTFRFIPGVNQPAAIQVLGGVRDVLYAQVSTDHLRSRHFSQTEFSIGLGGLGDKVEDYFPIMGEMITIGGTMVWLPTDGHDTPDFLIPATDTGAVTLRTAYNISIVGGFNELVLFDSHASGGTAISQIYRTLFDLSKERRPDYAGALGLAMRAQMASVLGSGVKKSPIRDFAPANGEMISSPGNYDAWFDADRAPRHSDVTALICGVGVDLTVDTPVINRRDLDLLFYIHPANVGSQTQLLHNHAVVFERLPMAEQVANLKAEIRSVVEQGVFVDMRHLLDSSAITRAFIGVSYIQSILPA